MSSKTNEIENIGTNTKIFVERYGRKTVYSIFLQFYEINPVDDGANLSIIVPKDATDGYINNKREDFRFRSVDQIAKQRDILYFLLQFSSNI